GRAADRRPGHPLRRPRAVRAPRLPGPTALRPLVDRRRRAHQRPERPRRRRVGGRAAVRLLRPGRVRRDDAPPEGRVVRVAFRPLRAAQSAGPRAGRLREGPEPRPDDLDGGGEREAADERGAEGRLSVADERREDRCQPVEPRRRLHFLAWAAAPYLHTGRMNAIEDVLAFYRTVSERARLGRVRNASPVVARILLAQEDPAPLAAFRRSLNEDCQ